MPTINGINVPENIVNDDLFINAHHIASQWVKKGGEYNPIVSSENVNVCGVKIIKELFDNDAFRLGLTVGCSKNVVKVSFSDVVYVQYFLSEKSVVDTTETNNTCIRTTFVGECITEPTNYEKKTKSKRKPIPILHTYEHLKITTPTFPFAQYEPSVSEHSEQSEPISPTDVIDIENNVLKPNHVLVFVNFVENKCFRTNTNEFKHVRDFFQIIAIKTIMFKGKTLNRECALNPDGSLPSDCTLSIECKKKLST